MPIGMLLRFARAMVERVVQMVFGQLNIVDNLVQTTLRSFIQTVVSGAWQGSDADAFVAEIEQMVSKHGFPLVGQIRGINESITRASDIMDEADSKVQQLADNLGDIFAKVY